MIVKKYYHIYILQNGIVQDIYKLNYIFTVKYNYFSLNIYLFKGQVRPIRNIRPSI